MYRRQSTLPRSPTFANLATGFDLLGPANVSGPWQHPASYQESYHLDKHRPSASRAIGGTATTPSSSACARRYCPSVACPDQITVGNIGADLTAPDVKPALAAPPYHYLWRGQVAIRRLVHAEDGRTGYILVGLPCTDGHAGNADEFRPGTRAASPFAGTRRNRRSAGCMCRLTEAVSGRGGTLWRKCTIARAHPPLNAVELSNMPLQLTRACQLSVDVQRAGAARLFEMIRRPPRGPGSATIDHHVTALAAERQGVRRTGAMVETEDIDELGGGIRCVFRQVLPRGERVRTRTTAPASSADRRRQTPAWMSLQEHRRSSSRAGPCLAIGSCHRHQAAR